MSDRPKPELKLRRLGINTYKEAVIYMRHDCHVCRAEGFEVQARVKVALNGKDLIATLNMVASDILKQGEACLSEYALHTLGAREGASSALPLCLRPQQKRTHIQWRNATTPSCR